MSLEEEREQIKALKRKHTSNTKDLQRQIAHCKRCLLALLALFVCSVPLIFVCVECFVVSCLL